MKKAFAWASLFTLIAGGAYAQDSIDVKVAVEPQSAAEIVEAHQLVLDAARTICAETDFEFSAVRSRAAAERACVRRSYEAAVEQGREMNLAAFTNEAALVGTEFE
ncbi:hypothetical protein [Ponticaulis sp.]|uniref:hypothetical protein n=1 Tax=Ponticaulis sp. TaxID=2020902 RepID=UPI000C4EECA9|nr:hypothetical protein [Ponticaulis sp.]HBH91484.1 hypothetical protein [Hyphomonadaceae bacterium]MAJ07287.1 hypothetical protein [Ponticaulis sp.]MAJ10373.1 hypothetical protein [Ponticaulis sp.]MDF1680073.1 hypothetical protein [Ponticaulis sp.]HBJ92581.1 hypothetical protein [Hyphomonadaceae bacterium]|tara:strand:+ start:8568 stop:8885 length:318 start_codon:yes stop_codon:yes gene_type:complete